MKIFISLANHRAAQIALFGPDGWKTALPCNCDNCTGKTDFFCGGFYDGELEFTPEQAKILLAETKAELARFANDPYGGCENSADRLFVDQCRYEEAELVAALEKLGV